MIFLDVQVPLINKIYDFELDEEMPVSELVQKVTGIIAEKEEMEYEPQTKMYLYAMGNETILNESYSLKQQGIRGGERLVLI
ncbi:MAG: EsaB/YukD family protein [Suilimivivens sp.]